MDYTLDGFGDIESPGQTAGDYLDADTHALHEVVRKEVSYGGTGHDGYITFDRTNVTDPRTDATFRHAEIGWIMNKVLYNIANDGLGTHATSGHFNELVTRYGLPVRNLRKLCSLIQSHPQYINDGPLKHYVTDLISTTSLMTNETTTHDLDQMLFLEQVRYSERYRYVKSFPNVRNPTSVFGVRIITDGVSSDNFRYNGRTYDLELYAMVTFGDYTVHPHKSYRSMILPGCTSYVIGTAHDYQRNREEFKAYEAFNALVRVNEMKGGRKTSILERISAPGKTIEIPRRVQRNPAKYTNAKYRYLEAGVSTIGALIYIEREFTSDVYFPFIAYEPMLSFLHWMIEASTDGNAGYRSFYGSIGAAGPIGIQGPLRQLISTDHYERVITQGATTAFSAVSELDMNTRRFCTLAYVIMHMLGHGDLPQWFTRHYRRGIQPGVSAMSKIAEAINLMCIEPQTWRSLIESGTNRDDDMLMLNVAYRVFFTHVYRSEN